MDNIRKEDRSRVEVQIASEPYLISPILVYYTCEKAKYVKYLFCSLISASYPKKTKENRSMKKVLFVAILLIMAISVLANDYVKGYVTRNVPECDAMVSVEIYAAPYWQELDYVRHIDPVTGRYELSLEYAPEGCTLRVKCKYYGTNAEFVEYINDYADGNIYLNFHYEPSQTL